MKLLGPLLLAAISLITGSSSSAVAQPITFARNIAPLVYAHCAPCHHRGGDAPFSLVTYDEVRRHAAQVADVTRRGYMPPWRPSTDSGPFVAERRLGKEAIAQFARWSAAGAPLGEEPPPAPPAFSSGWLHGPPDLVLTLPAFELRADGPDVFRNMVVTVPGSDAHYVRGFQFRPGSPAVHHANVYVDRTTASRRLDEADPLPGYEGLVLRSAEFPDGHFLGWTPGQASPPTAVDLAWRVSGGNDLVVQLHMRPTGRSETVAPAIGLYFTDRAPTITPTILRLGRQNLDIPSGASAYAEKDSYTLPVDVRLEAVQPHAHYRARRVTVVAVFRDGRRKTLIRIPDWDPAWQDQYRYAEPFWLPAGTTIELEYRFDNSDANPRNPDHPPQRASWGWRSSDEMGDVWIQVTTRSESDRHRLETGVRRKMAEEDAIGSEVLVARNPDYASLRSDAAVIYLELGRPADAARHFAVVTRLEPDNATAWYNEGVALEGMGDTDAAAARYGRALALRPDYAAAHTNLGNLLLAGGATIVATTHFRDAIASDPASAEAHCGLARALTIGDQPAQAVREFQTALSLKPDWVPCMVSQIWLLGAHADAGIRRPNDAVALAERAAALTNRADATVLDALGVAYAAAGRFADAVGAAEAALRLAQQRQGATRPADIRERLASYRQRRAVVIE